MMFSLAFAAIAAAAAAFPFAEAVSSQTYSWNNVKIGGGGGFIPSIVFNPSEKVGAFQFFERHWRLYILAF